MSKSIKIQYFAILREQRKLSEETFVTSSHDLRGLYLELQDKYKFTLSVDLVRPVVNNVFVDWSTDFNNDDQIVFIPPVAGG